MVNLARDGRWGRNLETPGEDPYVSGEYATEFVQGFQRAPADDGAHLLASACCKHYVVTWPLNRGEQYPALFALCRGTWKDTATRRANEGGGGGGWEQGVDPAQLHIET